MNDMVEKAAKVRGRIEATVVTIIATVLGVLGALGLDVNVCGG